MIEVPIRYVPKPELLYNEGFDAWAKALCEEADKRESQELIAAEIAEILEDERCYEPTNDLRLISDHKVRLRRLVRLTQDFKLVSSVTGNSLGHVVRCCLPRCDHDEAISYLTGGWADDKTIQTILKFLGTDRRG